MYAYQPQKQSPTPSPRPKVRRRVRQRTKQQSLRQRAVLIELGIKTSVNCALTGVAIAAIANLVPYHLSQRERLAEIQVEVTEAEYRVNQLRQDFNANFDAYESPKLMQEHSDKVDSFERRIIWVEPDAAAD